MSNRNKEKVNQLELITANNGLKIRKESCRISPEDMYNEESGINNYPYMLCLHTKGRYQ